MFGSTAVSDADVERMVPAVSQAFVRAYRPGACDRMMADGVVRREH